MNGAVNVTMESPMNVSLPSPPVNHKPVMSKDFERDENHSGSSNDTVNSNNINSEVIQDHTDNGNQEHLANNFNNDIRDQESDECSNDKVTTQDHSNKDLTNNHSSNSNESHLQTMMSLHTESVTTEQNVMMTLDEKTKNCDPKKVFNKTIPDDELRQCSEKFSSDEVDSEEDSSDEGSIVSKRQMAEDTLSINSDSQLGDGDSHESKTKANNKDDIIILDNENRPASQNGNSHDFPSPEIHEITSDNDDCILENVEKIDASISEDKVNLRRSSRAVKTKRYTDIEYEEYESDIEEVEVDDPLGCKTKPIVINDTKYLVEMAAKQVRLNQSNEKKAPTIVIIDSQSGNGTSSKKDSVPSTTNMKAQNLYQSIVARGTTVTPVSGKTITTSSTQSSPQPSQPVILPSLTDDMFVVEAPSFIVPYVYEKPSVKPFREFVNILGKELEQQIAKEKQEQLEKQKAEKEKREKLKREKQERGEEVSDSEDEAVKSAKINETQIEEKNKKKRERRKQRNDDDASWDGESSEDSEDETLSDIETVVIKDKADSVEIKDVTHLTAAKVGASKSDNYFDCSLGKFFIDIGMNLVQEYVQTDLLKHQNRKLYKEKKSGRSTKTTQVSIASLMKNLEFSKENNAAYTFPQIKCEFCSFKTESNLVMNNHLETPHMKNNVYKCNYCEFEIRSPRDILYHMEAEHSVKGKLERAPSYHQCPNCTFEDNGKGKLARHQMACVKKFKPEINLAPSVDWEPPAKIPKIAKARNNMLNTYQNAFNRQLSNNLSKPISIANLIPPANIANSGFRPRGRSLLNVPSRSTPVHGASIQRGGAMVRHNSPSTGCNYPIANNGKKPMQQPSISITPLPRVPQPQPVQQPNNNFVICEICDGYIKDLEQLRNHMQWIHKVKIHPKMIYNRPPLNCQKCQFRFFTDQGLERHLLGSHGLVTSSMHEAANKGKDAGRCPVCGRVYQWKLLNHVAKDHNLTLKPAHLSYKCTVCTATFDMYKHFENHVYSAHSVVAKRLMDKSNSSPAPAKASNDLHKPLKINDEITIIPQPGKPTTSSKTK